MSRSGRSRPITFIHYDAESSWTFSDWIAPTNSVQRHLAPQLLRRSSAPPSVTSSSSRVKGRDAPNGISVPSPHRRRARVTPSKDSSPLTVSITSCSSARYAARATSSSSRPASQASSRRSAPAYARRVFGLTEASTRRLVGAARVTQDVGRNHPRCLPVPDQHHIRSRRAPADQLAPNAPSPAARRRRLAPQP